MIERLDPSSAAYRRDYNNGWDTSARGADDALDRADARGVSHAWYDGYHDQAAGRPKWHLRDCRGCPEHPIPLYPAAPAGGQEGA
jgi:hypothetical protein